MKTTLNKLAIAEFAKDEGLELLSEYAELREKGLRKQALKKIREFVEGTKDYDDEKKRVTPWGQVLPSYFLSEKTQS